MTQTTNLQHSYSVLVKEARDDHTNEWLGKVSLMPQQNGDIYIRITFTNETDSNSDSTRQSASSDHRLTIDSI